MRILLLTSSFAPRLGGVETYLLETVHALSAHDVTVVAPSAPPPSNGASRADPAPPPATVLRYDDRVHLGAHQAQRALWTLGGLPSKAPLFALDLALNRTMSKRAAQQARCVAALETDAFDLFLAATALPSGILATLLSLRAGRPSVILAHGMELLVPEVRPTHLRLLERVLGEATTIGAVSEFTAELVAMRGVPRDRIRRVDPGIDPEPFVRGGRSSETWAERFGVTGKRVLLTHGRLDSRKGHDMVVRALPEIVTRYPEAVYLVTGSGAEEPALRELISSLGLGPHVVLAGSVDKEALPEIYALAEIVLVPSRRVGFSIEGFGIVCLEAAAAGKPVIAGRSGGLPSAVADGDTGILVDPDSPAAIAAAVLALLGDRGRAREMGERGRERVVRQFDRRAFARRIGDLVAAASRS